MRILQLVSSTGFYGAEQMVNLLSTSLARDGALVCLGLFNAEAPTSKKFVEEAARHRIPVWNLPCRGRIDLTVVRNLVNFLQRNRIDVLHTHGYKADIYGLIAAKLARCPVVATCHNWTERTTSLRRYASLDRLALRHFDMVAAVSQGITSKLRHAGIRRTRTIANGIDVARYRVDFGQTGAEQHLVVGCLSRLSQEKGVDVLLWALPKLLRAYPQLHCFVAGDGPEKERLKMLACELGVSASFHMPGFCEDTPYFLKYCTVVVQPSRIEAMPLAVLEAMAAGKAIVASAVGEIPRLLEDGHAGVLVPPESPEMLADAILEVLSNETMRRNLEKRAADKAASQFDAAIMGVEYMKLYQAAVWRSTLRGRKLPQQRAGGVL